MSFDPRLASRLKGSRRRTLALMGLVLLPFLVIAGRVGQLGLSDAPEKVAAAKPEIVLRGRILDRNGMELARTEMLKSAYAYTGSIADPLWTALQIKSILPDRIHNVEALVTRLGGSKGSKVAIVRGMSPQLEQAFFDLGLPGFISVEEPKRLYPLQSIAGQVVGFTDVDLRGLAGAEAAFDAELAAGQDVRLSLDLRVQTILEEELEWGASTFRAAGAAGVLIDAHSGELLAMAGFPSFDPNLMPMLKSGSELSPVSHATYELGSVFKPLTVASGLEAGQVSLRDKFDVSQGIKAGPRTFREKSAPAQPFTLAEVIAKSSNVGTIKIALDVGARRQQDFFASLGLFDSVDLPLPGMARPQLPSAPNWDELTTATTSYGHGINVSPLAMAQAYVPFARGGEMARLRLRPLDPDEAPIVRRVMSTPTAQVVVELMRDTVKSGTARRLASIGYDVAGKTGTANKNVGAAGYDLSLRVTSFAAILPASQPRYVLFVMLDEPDIGIDQDEHADAGRTAVPTAARIIERIAPILDLQPLAPGAAEDVFGSGLTYAERPDGLAQAGAGGPGDRFAIDPEALPRGEGGERTRSPLRGTL